MAEVMELDMYQKEVARIQRLVNVHADTLQAAKDEEINLADLDRSIRILLGISHRIKSKQKRITVTGALTSEMGRVN